jgi:hypothetical protein
MRAGYLVRVRQNRLPRAPLRGASGVLDPSRSGMTRACRLSTTETEKTMIALYDHIQQLRAELRGCYFTRSERQAVQAELTQALADQAELDRAFDHALEALHYAEAVGAA